MTETSVRPVDNAASVIDILGEITAKSEPELMEAYARASGTETRSPSGAASCTVAILQPSRKLCTAAARISGPANPCSSLGQAA